MSNIEYDGVTLIGRTYRNDDKSSLLTIPAELAKILEIENSKVLMTLLKDFEDNRYLVISKFHHEIVID